MSFSTNPEAQSSPSLESLHPCRQLTFSEIQVATQDFDESLVIGRGGFGKVYRGTITNGTSLLDAAIKRLDSTSNQGATEFWAEVEMLSKLRHCHLVSLIGYCNDRQEMILVYEYMPHGTLEDHLHKRPIPPLPWVLRLKICIGAARGLDYLHTGTGDRVIHRDVKSSNILLDNIWAAKISDFGLSKVGPTNQPSTYVNTVVRGTFGYLDPDYYSTGKLTRKSDVYAFGVVLLEVLCGKRAVFTTLDEEACNLAIWAQDSIKEGMLKQMVDSNIRSRISPKCLKKFAQLADRCLHSNPKQRPTMAQVVVILESVLALQEKTNTLHPGGKTIFGRNVPAILFSSNGENSDGEQSLRSLQLYLDTVGGERRILFQFDFDAIIVATENFSEANKILDFEESIFYKGRLQNGQDIAIARPRPETTWYEARIDGVKLLAKLEHENLIRLLGYCIKGKTMFYVYEFASHGSLDRLIFDPECTILDWNKRYKIILGVARVLLYLHKHAHIPIIHGDVKPRNILLDENLDPKLSSFLCATCLPIDKTDGICVDQIRGTWGYMAPEHFFSKLLSTKADVYGFGVSVLETISGRRMSDDVQNTNLGFGEYIRQIQQRFSEGMYLNMVHPMIATDLSSITRFIHIGLLCIQYKAADRPTMEEVVGMLLGNSSLPSIVAEMFQGSWENDSELLFSDNECDSVDDEDLLR